MKQWLLLPVMLLAGAAMACPGMKEKDAGVSTPASVAATAGTVERLAQKAPAAKTVAAKAATTGQPIAATAQKVSASAAPAEGRKPSGV